MSRHLRKDWRILFPIVLAVGFGGCRSHNSIATQDGSLGGTPDGRLGGETEGGDSGDTDISPDSPTGPTGAEEIDLDLAASTSVHLKQGLVNGPNVYTSPNAVSDTADNYLSALELGAWRFSGFGNVYGYGGDIYGFVVRDYHYHSRFGTLIVVNLQDIFNARYGRPVKVARVCMPGNLSCFTSFGDLETAWKAELQQFLIDTSSDHIDYLELLAEPNLASFQNITADQIYLLLKDAYSLVKTYHASAKLVGPSNSNFSAKVYDALLAKLASDGLHLDAISWHELGDNPEVIAGHVAALKSLFNSHPQTCVPSCPEIHVNEYQSETTSFIPGDAVGWLENLENAHVDVASRACWGGDAGSPISYESCWYGFSGLLTQDYLTPQTLYWIYKYYADLGSARYAIENSPPKIAALSGQLSGGDVGVLIGNYDGTNTARLSVRLKNFASGSARVEISRIANDFDKPVAVPNIAVSKSMTINARDTSLAFDVGDVAAGDAYWITVAPR